MVNLPNTNKKHLLFFLLIFVIFSMTSCTKNKLIGEWGFAFEYEQIRNVKVEIKLTFTDDGNFSYSAKGFFDGKSIEILEIGEYKVDMFNKTIELTEDSKQFLVDNFPQQWNAADEFIKGKMKFKIQGDILTLTSTEDSTEIDVSFRKITSDGIIKKLFDEEEDS